MSSLNDQASSTSLRRISKLFIAAALGAAAAGWQPPMSAAAPAEGDYEYALQLAREGRHEQALEILSALTERHPENTQYRYDHVTVLGWAGRDREALDAALGLDLAQAPAYVLHALGKSARNRQDFPLAARIYRAALERDPSDRTAGIGLALALADGGETGPARETAAALAARRPEDIEALGALAYVQQRQGLPFEALDTYERMLHLDPDNADARRGRIMTAFRLGAPHLAATLADETPGVLTADEREEIERDKQAIAIRWGRLPATARTAPERKAYVAISDLRHELEALAAKGQDDTAHARRLRYDLLVSLHERGRDRQAIELYETRIAAEDDVPAYVLATAGQAYLAQRRPEEARDLFLRALEQEPQSFSIRLSLFYAYVEAEDFKRALPLIDEIAAGEPAWLGVPPNRRANSARLRADLAAAYARAFADDPAGADRRVAPLAQGAPLNAELRAAQATFWLWRGWPRRAIKEYEMAINGVPPDLPDAHAGRGHALLDVGDYAKADEALRGLRAIAPDGGAARRLARDRELRHMRALRLEMSRTESSGTQEGSENLGLDGWLYSAPLKYRYRPFLHYHFRQAELPEGTAVYRRAGAGVEYRARDVVVTAEVDRDAGDAVNAGVAVNGRWTPSDHWSFTAGADSYSDEVPLRGRLNEGIDGWSVDLGADWRAHEGRSVHAGVGMAEFSDDNRRSSARLRGAQRLITRPHYRMDGLLGVYASRNTREDAPYFNPASDVSADFTLNNDWLLYRRYGHSFRHRLALSAGSYYQEDFGSGPIWALQYEQRWSPHDQFTMGYGFIRARRVYDGAPEYQTTLYLNLDWRF